MGDESDILVFYDGSSEEISNYLQGFLFCAYLAVALFLVWSIFLCSSYSFLIGMLELRDPRDVWKDVKATTWPALRSAWRFWPFVHTISFSHAVPMDLKLLWVDVMEVVWVTILSKVNIWSRPAVHLDNISHVTFVPG